MQPQFAPIVVGFGINPLAQQQHLCSHSAPQYHYSFLNLALSRAQSSVLYLCAQTCLCSLPVLRHNKADVCIIFDVIRVIEWTRTARIAVLWSFGVEKVGESRR